jgi:hypothetical protein
MRLRPFATGSISTSIGCPLVIRLGHGSRSTIEKLFRLLWPVFHTLAEPSYRGLTAYGGGVTCGGGGSPIQIGLPAIERQ